MALFANRMSFTEGRQHGTERNTANAIIRLSLKVLVKSLITTNTSDPALPLRVISPSAEPANDHFSIRHSFDEGKYCKEALLRVVRDAAD